ncbi:MAG: ATP-binding protein [Oscillibacter sp.]
MTRRPFRSPHHTASAAVPHRQAGRCCGRGRSLWPTTACLFLDELPEFHRDGAGGSCASPWRTAR